jgi:hypothetical protein
LPKQRDCGLVFLLFTSYIQLYYCTKLSRLTHGAAAAATEIARSVAHPRTPAYSFALLSESYGSKRIGPAAARTVAVAPRIGHQDVGIGFHGADLIGSSEVRTPSAVVDDAYIGVGSRQT